MSEEKDPQLKHRIFHSKKDESEQRQEIEQKIDDLKSESNSLRIDKSMMEEPPEVECTPEDREAVDRKLDEIEEEKRQLFHELHELDEKLMKEAEEEAKAPEAGKEPEPPRVEFPEEPEVEVPENSKEEKSEKDKESSTKRMSSKGRGRTYHGPIKENWARGSRDKPPLPKPTNYGGITRNRGEDEEEESSAPMGLDWWAKELHDTEEEVEEWTELEKQLLRGQNQGQPPGPQPTGRAAIEIFQQGMAGIEGKELERTLMRAFKAWVYERYPEEQHSQWRPWHIWTRLEHWVEYLSEDQIKQVVNTYGPFLEAEEQGEFTEAPPLPDVAVTMDQIEAYANEVFDRRNEEAGVGDHGQLGPTETDPLGGDNYDMGLSPDPLDDRLDDPYDDQFKDPLDGPSLDPWHDWLDSPSRDPRDRWLEKKY